MSSHLLLAALALGGLAIATASLWLVRWLELRRARTAPPQEPSPARRRDPVEPLTIDLEGEVHAGITYQTGHHDFVAVVGEAHFQPALRRLFEEHDRGAALDIVLVATLLPEPDNIYDPNAVAVVIDGHGVGYLSREVARSYQAVLARQPAPVTCPAKLTGGRGSTASAIGVLLDFEAVRLLKPGRVARPRA